MKKFSIIILFAFCLLKVNAQWERIGYNTWPNKFCWALAIQADTLLAGFTDCSLYRSIDNGQTWDRVCILPGGPIWNMIIKDNNYFIGTGGDGLFVSHNYGQTWDNFKLKSDMGKANSIYNISYYIDNIIVGTDNGLFKSSDKGNNWENLPCYNESDFSKIFTLISYNENTLIASTGSHTFLTNDMGLNWKFINKNIGPDISSLAMIDNNIFAILYRGYPPYVVMSSNEGNKWDTIHHFINDTIIKNLKVCGNNIYALMEYIGSNPSRIGFYSSLDMGKNWINLTGNLNYSRLDSYLFNENYAFICYSGMIGDIADNGIFRAPLKDCAIVTNPTDIPESTKESSLNISPNPASNNISISFPLGINPSIHIYNSLGIEIKRFEEKELMEKNSININMEEFSSGVYYCTINSGIEKITKSFVVIR